MSPEAQSPEFGFGPRTTPDLVASADVLNSVLLGMEHLRRRLQTAQRDRAKLAESAVATAPHVEASTTATAANTETRNSAHCWFYLPNESALSA